MDQQESLEESLAQYETQVNNEICRPRAIEEISGHSLGKLILG